MTRVKSNLRTCSLETEQTGSRLRGPVLFYLTAAHEWAKRAMDYAKAAGQSLDAASLDAWLDKAKQPEMKKLQEIDPDSYREQYDTAAGVAQELYMT